MNTVLTNKKVKQLRPPAQFDVLLLGVVVALVIFGILMVFSTSGSSALQKYGDSYFYIKRQLVACSIGAFGFIFLYFFPVRLLEKIAKYFFPLAILFLISPWVPGISEDALGARRWINLGPVNVQPGEFSKLMFIIFISWYIKKIDLNISKFFSGICLPAIMFAVLAFLFMIQPDFGSTAVLAMISGILLFIMGVKLSHIFILAILGASLAVAAVVSSPYRLKRVLAFLNPEADLLGKNYQLHQSLIAVGSGGVDGVGIGNSAQKLFYLPEAHTDFIFAVTSEELGFLGAILVLTAYLFILWRGFRISKQLTEDRFLFPLSCGLTFLIVLPALVNMCVVLGIFPTKGLVLPLIGYGGSNIIVSLCSIGLLLGIGNYAVRQRLKGVKYN